MSDTSVEAESSSASGPHAGDVVISQSRHQRPGSAAEARRLPGLLQRGTEPRVLGGPHTVRGRERTPGSPCGPQQHTVGISLPGPGSVATGSLIRNRDPQARGSAAVWRGPSRSRRCPTERTRGKHGSRASDAICGGAARRDRQLMTKGGVLDLERRLAAQAEPNAVNSTRQTVRRAHEASRPWRDPQ